MNKEVCFEFMRFMCSGEKLAAREGLESLLTGPASMSADPSRSFMGALKLLVGGDVSHDDFMLGMAAGLALALSSEDTTEGSAYDLIKQSREKYGNVHDIGEALKARSQGGKT